MNENVLFFPKTCRGTVLFAPHFLANHLASHPLVNFPIVAGIHGSKGLETEMPYLSTRLSLNEKRRETARTLVLACALSALSVAAFAYSGDESEQRACRRDVARHCRSVVKENQFIILACLQSNRPRLTTACRSVLESHGQ